MSEYPGDARWAAEQAQKRASMTTPHTPELKDIRKSVAAIVARDPASYNHRLDALVALDALLAAPPVETGEKPLKQRVQAAVIEGIRRGAFRAGFNAVCNFRGEPRVWTFDGIAAGDLEPDAYAAWNKSQQAPESPAVAPASAEGLDDFDEVVGEMFDYASGARYAVQTRIRHWAERLQKVKGHPQEEQT